MAGIGMGSAVGTWGAPECPYKIEYSARVLDDIRRAVVDAFFSLPHGGAEVGGILLGSFSGGKISIQDYQALDCEHAMGPSFTLSPRDQAQLAAMMAADGRGRRVVGWYHSHTRSDIFLSPADQDIHNRFFPEPWQVALVLKPHTFEPARCGFFFREADGSIRGAASFQEFGLEPLPMKPAPAGDVPALPKVPRPLRPEAEPAAPVIPVTAEGRPEPEPLLPLRREMELPIAAAEKEASSGLPIAVPARIPTPPAATQQPAAIPPPATDRQPRKLRVLKTAGWLILALLILASGVLIGTPFFRERGLHLWSAVARPPAPAPPSPPVPLGLQAEQQNGDLKLTWNRRSAAILGATSAVLSIQDGSASRKIDLDSAQIRTGSVLYAPTSGQIQMELTVSAPQGTTSESVLIIRPETGAPQVRVLPNKGTPAAAIGDAKPPNAAPPRPPGKPFTLPAAPRPTQAAGSSVAINEPPDLVVKSDPVASIPLALGQPVVPPVRPAPAPPAPPPQAAAASPQSPAATSYPTVYPPAIVTSVPAVYPRELRSFSLGNTTVEIKVSIDEDGRVVKAEPVPKKGFVPQSMIQSAIQAARRFKFFPAHIGNQAVPGDMILRFDFKNP